VFELYTSEEQYFVRVLWGGQPMVTSLPLGNNGTLEMVPVNDFFDCTLMSSLCLNAYMTQISWIDIDGAVGTDGTALIDACRG